MKQRLHRKLVDAIEDILRHMYDARPNLHPMIAIDTDAKTVKATKLIDLCYNVSVTCYAI